MGWAIDFLSAARTALTVAWPVESAKTVVKCLTGFFFHYKSDSFSLEGLREGRRMKGVRMTIRNVISGRSDKFETCQHGTNILFGCTGATYYIRQLKILV